MTGVDGVEFNLDNTKDGILTVSEDGTMMTITLDLINDARFQAFHGKSSLYFIIKYKMISATNLNWGGQSFTLCDFEHNNATWIKPINTYSFGGKTEEYIQTDNTNQKYVALKDFSVEGIYIKIKEGQDEVYFELAH